MNKQTKIIKKASNTRTWNILLLISWLNIQSICKYWLVCKKSYYPWSISWWEELEKFSVGPQLLSTVNKSLANTWNRALLSHRKLVNVLHCMYTKQPHTWSSLNQKLSWWIVCSEQSKFSKPKNDTRAKQQWWLYDEIVFKQIQMESYHPLLTLFIGFAQYVPGVPQKQMFLSYHNLTIKTP